MATRANAAKQLPVTLDEMFYCRSKRRRVALARCLDGYMEANAFSLRRSACWRCPQGRKIRENYATS